MPDLRPISVPSDARTEAALSLMPARGQEPAEVFVVADNLVAIDAWGATALRVAIEFHARVQQQKVCVGPPTDDEAWRMLYHLLATDCPKHVILTHDSTAPDGGQPSAIQMPTVRVQSPQLADQVASALMSFPKSRLTPALRFLATQFEELALNALAHAKNNPIAPVACCFYDAEEDEVQLVVSDLGSTYDRDPDAAAHLLAAVRADSESALNAAVEAAAARELDVTLTLAAGVGRVYWKAGKWSTATAQAVPGFTVGLAVQL